LSAPAQTWASTALTPLEARDLAKLNAWQNDPEVRDLIQGFRGPVRQETTEAWIDAVTTQSLKTRAVFAVRRDGEIVGVAQLQSIDWVQRTALLGIYIGDVSERGAGLGAVATSLLLDYAFNGLDLVRVGLDVLASSAAARRLYERLGFVPEGTLREAFLRAGTREDIVLYGLLKREWTADLPAEARRLVSPA
jgi:RimJ/RimL family protein N-acetyltransferase